MISYLILLKVLTAFSYSWVMASLGLLGGFYTRNEKNVGPNQFTGHQEMGPFVSYCPGRGENPLSSHSHSRSQTYHQPQPLDPQLKTDLRVFCRIRRLSRLKLNTM